MGTNIGVDHIPGRTKATAGTPAMDVARLRRVFAGLDSQLQPMRSWLSSLLPPGALCDDVLSVATELGTNALQHTATGHGGSFAVELTCSPSADRITVTDNGGPSDPRLIDDPDAEHGRGLLLVCGLAARMGVAGDGRGRQVWAEIARAEAYDEPVTRKDRP